MSAQLLDDVVASHAGQIIAGARHAAGTPSAARTAHGPAGARAVYAWFSDERLLVAKGGRSIELTMDDLMHLRWFLQRFGDLSLPGGGE